MLLMNSSHIPWKSKSAIVLKVFSSVFPLKTIALGKDLFNQQIQENRSLTSLTSKVYTMYILVACEKWYFFWDECTKVPSPRLRTEKRPVGTPQFLRNLFPLTRPAIKPLMNLQGGIGWPVTWRVEWLNEMDKLDEGRWMDDWLRELTIWNNKK